MSKGIIFVSVCSVAILVLFAVFCYLITTVNPDPIAGDDVGNESQRKFDFKSKNIYFNDVLFPTEEGQNNLRYGLEKVDVNDITTKATFAPKKLMVNNKYNYTGINEVYPPIWVPIKIQNNTDSTTKVINANVLKINTSEALPVKGKRRSISNIKQFPENEHKSETVVLKIVDDTGIPGIEIKLDPKGSFENKRSRKNISAVSRSVQKTLNYSGVPVDNHELFNYKDTFIIILPNNTIQIDENDQSLISFSIATEKPSHVETTNSGDNIAEIHHNTSTV
ncbi:uncharacterized protein LOC116413342 [Galleria mellonella]|uniref:Uncharacterized protein LOC116413342 n=1 Tax=Galleria mellonella TaxID=7137 RepID=A0A6J3C500_GALME|nr:uncharacterized protein LOC116413342 [Galleria mellonella]